MAKGKTPSKGGRNTQSVRVKTAKGRKASSTRWLKRQLNDPYVRQAKEDGYRSRAAYKLTELDGQFHVLGKGKTVVDLGAAPGSWSQVAQRLGCRVIGIDLQEMEPLEGAIFLQGDFLEEEMETALLEALEGQPVHVVLSDMAAASCGHPQTDHIRIMALCETALDFALKTLASEGAFIAKVLRGGAENELLRQMKQYFSTVKHVKPEASRKDSAEMYVVALGFKGRAE